MKFYHFLIVSMLMLLSIASFAYAENEGLRVDQEKKEIAVSCDINGKYFTIPTEHAIVSVNGKNAQKSVFRAHASEIDFYHALISLGAKPGKNMDMAAFNAGESRDASIRGDELALFVTWEGLGKELPMEDVIIQGEKRPMEFHFSDNLMPAENKKTGCIVCFRSCPVGIVGNLSFPYDSREPYKFYGNEKVLPKDGSNVTVIFRLKK